MGMNVKETLASPLVWHPQTPEEAWLLKQTYGADSIYISGGTLLRTHWESGLAAMPQHFIDLSTIRGLNELRIGEAGLLIGGQATLQTCRTNVLLQRYFPMITEAIRVIAAPSIRQLATIGGNVASYIGDSIVALLGYDAEVIWYDGKAEQCSFLMDWLQSGQGSKNGDERLLLQMLLPFEEMDQETMSSNDAYKLISLMKRFGAYHKVGRREGFTPSVVTTCINGRLTDSGIIQHIRIAVGGGQTIPARLGALEKEITGANVDNQLLQHVYERVLQLFSPREDLFASADYRKSTAANLIVAELWKAVSEDSEEGG